MLRPEDYSSFGDEELKKSINTLIDKIEGLSKELEKLDSVVRRDMLDTWKMLGDVCNALSIKGKDGTD